MPANSRWDLIQRLKGLKCFVNSATINKITAHSKNIILHNWQPLCQVNCAVYWLTSTSYGPIPRIVRVFGNDIVCVALCASNKGSISRAMKPSAFILVLS